jgi:hypothetical protein
MWSGTGADEARDGQRAGIFDKGTLGYVANWHSTDPLPCLLEGQHRFGEAFAYAAENLC